MSEPRPMTADIEALRHVHRSHGNSGFCDCCCLLDEIAHLTAALKEAEEARDLMRARMACSACGADGAGVEWCNPASSYTFAHIAGPDDPCGPMVARDAAREAQELEARLKALEAEIEMLRDCTDPDVCERIDRDAEIRGMQRAAEIVEGKILGLSSSWNSHNLAQEIRRQAAEQGGQK